VRLVSLATDDAISVGLEKAEDLVLDGDLLSISSGAPSRQPAPRLGQAGQSGEDPLTMTQLHVEPVARALLEETVHERSHPTEQDVPRGRRSSRQ
jgi:hypothetical protein